ncbi:hypothetical protein [Nostoc sp.]|uniref:hypothetical protein n=1 Tax=Nostoc sp. TaxID=1180 RepID=UPI002FF9BB08
MTATQLLIPQPHTSTSIETVGRHPLNFYESPSWFTTELLRHVIGLIAVSADYPPTDAVKYSRFTEMIQLSAPNRNDYN